MTLAQGTDLSHFNAFKPGRDFTFHKATEGTGYVDPEFAARWKLLAGGTRGAYGFLDPGPGAPQGSHFVSTLGEVFVNDDDVLAQDYEAAGLTVAEAVNWWVVVAKAYPKNPKAEYGHPDDVEAVIAACAKKGIVIGRWPALWGNTPPAKWDFWQYGFSGGMGLHLIKRGLAMPANDPQAAAQVDGDKFNGTAAELAAYVKGANVADTETQIEQKVSIGERMAKENYLQTGDRLPAGTGIPVEGWTQDDANKYAGVHGVIGFLVETDKLAALGSGGGGSLPLPIDLTVHVDKKA